MEAFANGMTTLLLLHMVDRSVRNTQNCSVPQLHVIHVVFTFEY